MKTKTTSTTPNRFRALLPASALLLLISLPAASFAAKSPTIDGSAADVRSDTTKAMLKAIDARLDALDKLEDNAPTRLERAAAKERIKALKERRSELRKNYVQSRYDSLKADIDVEHNKLSAWTKKTVSGSPDARLDRSLDRADVQAREAEETRLKLKASAAAAANPAAVDVNSEIVGYRNNPTDVTKAEVKASLAQLDTEIERLEARVEKMRNHTDRDAAKLRVKALKDQRGELNSDFRKARFDALIGDVKGEWHKIVD